MNKQNAMNNIDIKIIFLEKFFQSILGHVWFNELEFKVLFECIWGTCLLNVDFVLEIILWICCLNHSSYVFFTF